MLHKQARRWPGAIVASVWLLLRDPTPEVDAELRGRVMVAPLKTAKLAQYPINALRNTAIRAVKTSHFFVCDVDLWPSLELHAELTALDPSFWGSPQTALVIAAFTLDKHSGAVTSTTPLPKTTSELVPCVRAGRCSAFKGTAGFVPGQQLSTDYVRWWQSKSNLLPYRIPCFDKVSYEPYLIVARSNKSDQGAPLFDEEYTGYGKNKVQWVQKLRALGFRFWVLPRAFIVHSPHAVSESGRQWQRNSGNHKAKMDRLFDAQLAKERALDLSASAKKIRSPGGCPNTPTCTVPLLQQIDMMSAEALGKRADADILG